MEKGDFMIHFVSAHPNFFNNNLIKKFYNKIADSSR